MNARLHPGRRCVLAAALVLLAGGCERDGAVEEFSTAIGISEPDSFLRYLDAQASLPAGNYTLVVGTDSAGQAGSFTVTATLDDGSTRSFSGNWTVSGGADATAAANPAFTLALDRPGGVVLAASSATAVCLYLLRDPNDSAPDPTVRSGSRYAPADGGCVDRIELPASGIASLAYARAYYAAIDPADDRDTLAKWLSFNGFDAGARGHVRFRDTRDLGYGRNMFFRVNADGTFAAYVDNFQVQDIPGFDYTNLNLDALVANQRRHHIGTNAIEYSCLDPTACDCLTTPQECFVKFFTFLPASGGVQRRTLVQDLDGRGEKPMPGICVTCHGGETPPLLPDGRFANDGDVDAKLQFLEVDTFGFAERTGLRRTDQEATLKALNHAVYCTTPGADTAACATVGLTPPTPPPGDWPGYLALGIMEGCYGAAFSETRYGGDDGECDYVPPGWRPNPNTGSPPAGADQLYLQVVGPHCMVCHARQGSNLGTGQVDAFGADGNFGGGDDVADNTRDVDFSTWAKFVAHAADIERLVFEEGRMPLGLLNYNVFWNDPNKPALLGSFLPGFSHGNADGTVNRPGAPVARPGPSRTTTVPTRLSAAASRFAETYAWTVPSSPAGSTPTLSDASALRPVFDTDRDGEYQVRLTASAGGVSDSALVTLTVDSTLSPAPGDLTFDADVGPLLTATCATANCHQAAGAGSIAGVPVFWNAADQPNGTADEYFREVLARVNFAEPERSRLLSKPSGNHHYGGVVSGFDTADLNDRDGYDTVLNWILAGARRN